MPMRYANEDDVLALLQMDDSADEYDSVVRLENGLCDVVDHTIGTSFGTTPTAETRTVYIATTTTYPTLGFPYDYSYAYASWSPRLVLSVPLRSLTSIVTGGTWDGSAWDDGVTLETSDYLLTNRTEQGYYGIDRIGGSWGGIIHVTGVWGDQTTLTVPDDLAQALTELTVKEWHRRHASPAGEIGPGDLIITPGNPWNLEYIKATLDKYTVVEVML